MRDEDLVDRGHLREVAHRAEVDGAGVIARVRGDRQHDEGGPRSEAADEREAVIAVVGEADVAQDDVWLLAFDELRGVRNVRGRPDDLDVRRALEERREPVSEGRVILDDRQADHAGGSAALRLRGRGGRRGRVLPRPSARRRSCAGGSLRAAGLGARDAGKRTEIVVPSPIREVAVIVPPWAATISRDDEEPEAEPGRPLRLPQPRIGLEHDRQVLGGDAVAVIAHVDDGEPTRAPDDDVDGARPGGVLDRVRQQVQEDLLETAGVPAHDQRRGLRAEADRRRIGEHGRDVHRRADDRHQVDRLER